MLFRFNIYRYVQSQRFRAALTELLELLSRRMAPVRQWYRAEVCAHLGRENYHTFQYHVLAVESGALHLCYFQLRAR